MPQYLYAAAVQGIQDFIFDTNKLKEIAGASELVEQICTTEFKNVLGKPNFKEEQLLIGAAGNIKYIFNDDEKNLCEQIVRDFPFKVAQIAQGITISQTVVKIDHQFCSEDINKAEEQLKIQRNLPIRPSNLAWMIARRTPKTGKPAVNKNEDGEYIDKASEQKNKASEQKIDKKNDADESLFEKIVPESLRDFLELEKNVENIVSNDSSWIAVIHADGNDLGKIIPTLFENVKGNDLIHKQKDFSDKINKSTISAAKTAFTKVIDDGGKDFNYYKSKLIVPIRPVVCGGDDLTIIIQAQFALEFTRTFLEEFTKQTKENFANFGHEVLKNGLTACAGIAYVKQKYPFHYAVNLADELCKHAKKEAKKINPQGLTPACISFYKIASAFVRTYKEIQDDELTASIHGMNLSRCPYMIMLNQGRNTVDDLNKWTSAAKNNPAIASRLRQILSMLHTQDEEAIKFELERIKSLNKEKFKEFDIDVDDLKGLSHLHDFLSINSVSNTKEAENEKAS